MRVKVKPLEPVVPQASKSLWHMELCDSMTLGATVGGSQVGLLTAAPMPPVREATEPLSCGEIQSHT